MQSYTVSYLFTHIIFNKLLCQRLQKFFSYQLCVDVFSLYSTVQALSLSSFHHTHSIYYIINLCHPQDTIAISSYYAITLYFLVFRFLLGSQFDLQITLYYGCLSVQPWIYYMCQSLFQACQQRWALRCNSDQVLYQANHSK